MKNTRHLTLLFLFVVALLAIPTMLVAAKELNSITISGPGIKGELTLNDPEELMDLEQSEFFFQSKSVKPPENLGEGYKISVYLNLDGDIIPTIQMVYYPAEEGQQGYVHYTGRFNGDVLETVDEWSLMSLGAETPFRNLLAAQGITLQPAVLAAPESAPLSEPVADAPVESQPVVAAQQESLALAEVENIQIPVGANEEVVQPSPPAVSPFPMPTVYAGLLLAGIAIVFVVVVLALRRQAYNYQEAETGD